MLFAVGLCFGLALRKKPENKSLLATKAFWNGFWLTTLYVLVAVSVYLKYPDWMYMYYARASSVPHWMALYIMILYYFSYIAGFLLKFEFRKINPQFISGSALASVLAECYLLYVTRSRFLTVTSTEQFWKEPSGSGAVSLFSTPLLWMLIFALVVVSALGYRLFLSARGCVEE